MPEVTLEDLHGYLDEALSTEEAAHVEAALRQSASMRQILRGILQERDRGEHTVGGIWRRRRLSCPSREQLGSYVLGALEEGLQEYVEFHLKTVACCYCLANLADLQSKHKEPAAKTQQRKKRLFESSRGYLPKRRS